MEYKSALLYTAIIILIILLGIVGYMLNYQKKKTNWPPTVSNCPDFWSETPARQDNSLDGNQDNSNGETDESPPPTGICYNNNNIGKESCEKVMDFNETLWKGSEGACNKKDWAKSCNLTWDGITNIDHNC
jgi:hypothetical protein|uniref:CPW-WPC domain-containing protein n=1 Tax=viral metagenome TaxID=1070528 RepID=A0A6C0JBG0_9ZZZZ|tara:strand:- start:16 stop:408 length:393 start_codon:yes stop_codon:yes gene_type:complete